MKTYTPRRVRRSSAEWAEIVEQCKSSGQSLRVFASDVGVPLQSLYYWRSKLSSTSATSSSPQAVRGFTALTMDPSTRTSTPVSERTSSAIELQLTNGRIVRIVGNHVDPEVLRTVLAVAETGAPC